MILVVGKSKGNKQVNKNAAKEKSTDSNKKKKIVNLVAVWREVKAEDKSIDYRFTTIN
jgi:hypothetical protein